MTHIPYPPTEANWAETLKFPLEQCGWCGAWNHPPDAPSFPEGAGIMSETQTGGMEVDKTTTPWSPKHNKIGCIFCGSLNWKHAEHIEYDEG